MGHLDPLRVLRGYRVLVGQRDLGSILISPIHHKIGTVIPNMNLFTKSL